MLSVAVRGEGWVLAVCSAQLALDLHPRFSEMRERQRERTHGATVEWQRRPASQSWDHCRGAFVVREPMCEVIVPYQGGC